MERIFLGLAGVYGALAVGMGAFGAHGLKRRLAECPDRAQRLGWWQTGASYHLTHALALGVSAWTVARSPGIAGVASGWLFAVGVLVFSGSLYLMTLTGARRLGAITPLGGLMLIAGWIAIAWAAWSGAAG